MGALQLTVSDLTRALNKLDLRPALKRAAEEFVTDVELAGEAAGLELNGEVSISSSLEGVIRLKTNLRDQTSVQEIAEGMIEEGMRDD